MLVPRYRMSPDVGRYRPSISRPNVVLPNPVSPTSASVSPRLMAREIPSTALSVARRPPEPPWPVAKCLVTSTVSMIGRAAAGAGAPPTGYPRAPLAPSLTWSCSANRPAFEPPSTSSTVPVM